tara:strand:+ start:386 stop:568 length:183 start_codon:yes stop_codon:yes gene_type:complete
MSWEELLSKQQSDPEKVVGHKMVDGFKVPVNAYGKVPLSIHQETLDKIEALKAKIKEMKS